MGYTHYWYTPKELNEIKFRKFQNDCRQIFGYCQNEMGIKLADGCGEPGTLPVIEKDLISFNGSEEQPAGQWTTEEEVVLAWPSSTASLEESPTATAGTWFAGTLVTQRIAPINDLTGKGSGSYETCYFDRIQEQATHNEPENGLYFNCCKTSYRPYDLTVTAVLISLKHHFPECKISTDGEGKDWLDGRFLCQKLFGYGMETEIDI